MEQSKSNMVIKWAVTGSFVLMVLINALASLIPINGVMTGEVSDRYWDLFAPAGFTFAIWGLIYLLLAVYVLYQFGILEREAAKRNESLLAKIGVLFVISSLANAIWIFAWHYDAIFLSLIMMIIILVCLALIFLVLNGKTDTFKQKLFLSIPFSVYFGWITVATVANVTTYLVASGWGRWGISEPVWTGIILIVAAAIGMVVTWLHKNIAYGLVFIWAYVGILAKHFTAAPVGHDADYIGVIVVNIAMLTVMIAVHGCIVISKLKKS